MAIVGGPSLTFEYDNGARLKSRTELVRGRTLATTYSYEGDDLDLITYPSGRAVEYGYDTEGRIDKVRDVTGTDPSKHFDYAHTMRYHPSGALASYVTGNGLTHTVQFDGHRYWPSQIQVGSLLKIDYEEYDGVGNVGKITTKNGSSAPVSETFGYDALARLTSMSSLATYGTGEFKYDVHGNRISNTYGSYEYFPGTLQLKSQGLAGFVQNFEYYPNGNLKTAPNASYGYTPDNMLSTATTLGRQTGYAYDGDQLRVSRTITDTGTNVDSTSLFSYGPAGQLLGEYRAGSGNGFSVIREYIYAGSKLLAEVLPPTGGSPNVSVSLAVTSSNPEGEFLAPATATLTATASTTVGTIHRVEFFQNGVKVGTSLTPPYRAIVSGLEPGTYTFMARAVNASGQSARDEQIVRVIVVGHPDAIVVEPDPAISGQPTRITVLGTPPCGALGFNFGDGTEPYILPLNLPATITHTWAAGGTYTLTVTGHGDCRGTLTRQVVVSQGPFVTLTQPVHDDTVPVDVPSTIAATAGPVGSIARVDFFAGPTLVGSDSTAPYAISWTPDAPNPVVVQAVAYDAAGARAESNTALVLVSHLSGVSVSPALVRPGQSATVTVTGRSDCGAVTINYGDGTPLETVTGLPAQRTHTWTSVGTKTIVVGAHSQCLGSVSTTLTVVENSPPTVTLTQPTPGVFVTHGIVMMIDATAVDADGSIARVEFFAGATLLTSDTTFPYVAMWETTTLGPITFRVVAYDNEGAMAEATAAVTVRHLAAVLISPSTVVQGQPASVTVTGSSACNSVQVDYGDGSVITYPSLTAASQPHAWATTGTKTVTATGQGTCTGTVSSTVTVNVNPPPSVTLEAPFDGAAFSVPGGITLWANASDAHGVARVEFLRNGTVIGTVTAAPYTMTWPAPAGLSAISARAFDIFGVSATSAVAAISVNAPPSVTLTQPAAGASVPYGVALTVAATAMDAGSVARVDFFAGTTLLISDTTLPYAATWVPTTLGPIQLKAVAYDNEGAASESSAGVTVQHLGGVLVTPATVVPTQSATVTVTGHTACTSVRIDYGEGTPVTYPISGLPFSQSRAWATAGTKTVTATGQGGCTGSASATVTVIANPPPSVTLTSPADEAEFLASQSVTLSATATDAHGIARVEFVLGGAVIGTDTTAPYSMTWTPGTGIHTVIARAFDIYGVSAESAAKIHVKNIGSLSITPTTLAHGVPATLTVSGSGVCTSVRIDYGEGTPVTYPISGLPFTTTHSWPTSGTKTVTATGQGTCVGSASAMVFVNVNPPPTVTLTTPSTGEVYVLPQSVTLSATASDADGSVARVEFLSGATIIGTDTAAPYTMSWTPGLGTYSVSARAVDNGGVTATSAAATISVNNIGGGIIGAGFVTQGIPVTLTVPGGGACTSLRIDYSDGPPVTYPITGLPFTTTHTWTTLGSKMVTATGQGACVGSASATFVVNVNTPPSVALTAPSNGAVSIVPQSVTLSATASDADGAVARVEFLSGATIIGTDTAAPYTMSWTPAPGTYSVSARAVDNGGLTNTSPAAAITVKHIAGISVSPATVVLGQPATVTVTGSSACTSIQIEYDGPGSVVPYSISGLPTSKTYEWATVGTGSKTITVTGTGTCTGSASTTVTVLPNPAPSVTLTSPTNGAVYTASPSVTLSATASDDQGIAGVTFYNGATVIGTDSTAPYTMTWTPGPGPAAVTAQANDIFGMRATSAVANISVSHITGVAVAPGAVVQGASGTVTVSGNGTCNSVRIDYGDGTAVTYPITGFPLIQAHTWATTGSKTVTATGQGTCLGSASGTVTVNVNPPPSVALTAPAAGTIYTTGTPVAISADASDAHGVNRVEFYAGGALVGTDSSAPYAVTWTAAAGTVSIFARAYDALGASADSPSRSVIGHTIDPRMALDSPVNNSTTGQPIMIGGWAVDLGATAGSGVDAVHVYANPSGGGAAIFLGAPDCGGDRPDIGTAYGAQYRYSGFTLMASGLTPGTYTIVVNARSAVTGLWDVRTAVITIPTPNVLVTVDTPTMNQTVGQPFLIGGWAIDTSHPTASGVSALHVYAAPADGSPWIFVGATNTGGHRPDVASAHGARFAPSGWGMNASGLAPGWYTLIFYPWSTVTQNFRPEAAVTRTVYIAY